MKKYVVTFAHTRADSDLRVNASSHVFDTLKEARDYADEYTNAFITAVDGDDFEYVKTRQEIRFLNRKK